MNLFKQHPLVDIQKLEEEINGPPDPQIQREVQRALDEGNAFAPKPKEKTNWAPLQYIAYYCTQLCYKDAVAMGDGIKACIPDAPGDKPLDMTAAVQAWAQKWEEHK